MRIFLLACVIFQIESIGFNRYRRQLSLHLRLHCRMSVENETPQEWRDTSHSEEAHAERAASANDFVKTYFALYKQVTHANFCPSCL